MLFLLTDSLQKLKFEKIQENSSLLCKPEFSSATKSSCFIKNTKKVNTLQQVTDENTQNIVFNIKILSKNTTTDYEIYTQRKSQTKNQTND